VALFVLIVLATVGLGPAVRAYQAGWRRPRVVGVGVVVLLAAAAMTAVDPVGQKVVANLIMPTGWVWLGILAWGADAAYRGARRQAAGMAALFVVYTVAGNVVLGTLGLIWLQDQLPQVDWREGPPFDAVLVLGGGTKEAPEPSRFELSAAGDRVLLGARLYRAGRAKVLITSGRGVPGISEDDLTEATLHIWAALGIPEADVVRLREPYNTQQELQALKALVAERGWTRVGLVSSAYHLPRALAQARRLGLEVVPLGADHYQGPDRFYALALIPQLAGFVRTQKVAWELIGQAVGR
jgi:uncharacterized SAM-binding protein YcdF (DUF218 family)